MLGIGGKPINAENALAELTGKDAVRYADSMSPELFTSTRDLLGTMKDLQKKTTLDRVITYRQGRLVWGAGGGIVGSIFGHPTGGALAGLASHEGSCGSKFHAG